MYGTAGQKRISDGFLNNFPTPLPPFEEQKLIVAFLDCEIRRLDTLITNKRELIDLLQKKRNAIITDAVTKGLNLDVPLKDSGVSWIGKVPQHWEIRRFKFMLKYLEQGWSPACENRLADEEEWGVLKVGCVNGGYFNELEHKALPNNLEPKLEYEIKIGDVLISRANTKELLGSTAKVHSVQRNLLLCDKLYRIKTVSDVDPDFFVILLQSAPARYQFERESSGASDSMQNISQSSMGNFILPLAPIREQKLITEKLHEDFMIIGILKEKLVKQIGELQKYRQALITAAVTGKIDVREEFAQGVA
jgi:type I restriction enzyme S subunit